MKNTVLVTGAQGLLGTEVCRAFEAAGYTVRGIDIADADISRGGEVMPLISGLAPGLVVHCAALTDLNRCEEEPDAAYLANTVGTRNVAQAAAACGAELMYVSTDYVFGENAGRPLLEWDAPDPLNEYARSKLAGEDYVKTLTNTWYVVRIAGLFGAGGKNFVDTIIRLVRERGSVNVIADQVSNKTYAPDLADALVRLAGRHQFGTFHVANEGVCSWYEFAREAVERAGLDPDAIKPVTAAEYGGGVVRPAYSSFNMAAYRNAVGAPLRHYRDALDAFFAC